MVLSIHHHLAALIVNDEAGNLVCKIKSLNFWSPKKGIYNPKNKLIYTTDIVLERPILEATNQTDSRNYVAYRAMDPPEIVASASLIYAEQPSRQLLYKLPKVDILKIQSFYGEIQLRRANDKEFSIHDDQREIGKISLSLFPRESAVHCDSISDSEFLAVLFVFIGYMVHEDDLYVA